MADSVASPVISLSADGAIPTPSDLNEVIYYITKTSAIALTIVVPVAGVDDGKKITVISSTAYSHAITLASEGFNNKTSSGTITFAGKGGAMRLYAMAGHWWTGVGTGLSGATVA